MQQRNRRRKKSYLPPKTSPKKKILTAKKTTERDGTFIEMKGIVMFHLGLRLPLGEQVSSETREEVNVSLGTSGETIPIRDHIADSIADSGAGDIDNSSAVNNTAGGVSHVYLFM